MLEMHTWCYLFYDLSIKHVRKKIKNTIYTLVEHRARIGEKVPCDFRNFIYPTFAAWKRKRSVLESIMWWIRDSTKKISKFSLNFNDKICAMNRVAMMRRTADRWRSHSKQRARWARHEGAMCRLEILTCKLSVSWLFLVITENLHKYKSNIELRLFLNSAVFLSIKI